MSTFDWPTYYALKHGRNVDPEKLLAFLEKAKDDAHSADYREVLNKRYSELYQKWLELDPVEVQEEKKRRAAKRAEREHIILEWQMRNDNKPNVGLY